MSDQNETTTAQDERSTPTPAAEAPVTSTEAPAPVQPDVAVQENAVIGDENLPAPRDIDVVTDTDSVPAQVTGPPARVVETVPVHETHVTVDEVITDTSSPLAVQIPDAGRGSLDLPIHGFANSERPETFFAREASDPDKD